MFYIHGVIHTMEQDVFEDGFLQTEGSKIAAVGPMSTLSEIPSDAVDLKGACVYPEFARTDSVLRARM